ATEKAVRLVRAGINRTRLTEPLEPVVVETTPKSLVVGGGVAGLRAALGLAEVGLDVFLVEKEAKLGGWVAGFRDMFPHGRNGRELIIKLEEKVRANPRITVFTGAELVGKSGSFGNYQATIAVSRGDELDTIQVDVGSIVIATGFDAYRPAEGELGFGLDGVVTIDEFKKLLDETAVTQNGSGPAPLTYQGRPVATVAYIYCVGSRQDESVEGANTYCSRYCCTAAVHAATQVAKLPARVHQYHFYRDMRTYGKYELLYAEALEKGAAFVKFPDDEPPAVERDAKTGTITVTARDLLSEGEQVALTADLVVLVTGMVPRENEGLTKALKLPVGQSGFYNEIHPKLRPVETVVDGAYICGACQGPKTSSEAVASGLAAVTQSAAILKRGFAELDPLVATVDTDVCTWCGACETTCPYDAIAMVDGGGKEIAAISKTACKGCGGCVPVCPSDAIDLQGYTDAQIRSMIDGMLEVVCE
ncbi:MAG TPA: FAD-dependent oxidoreductase, partial [Thermoleophilia bacterium]|nr:FAD-dependent oxidoreductase [Thermoleophilia bacterium]